MEEHRIQQQIAIYKTSTKLCEFNDKLKPSPVEFYAHIHAQGEKLENGTRPRSCIGLVLQDYSNGTGDKMIRVTANLAPEFFAFALCKVQTGVEMFDFTEEKIFGDPDQNGMSMVTKVSIKRVSVRQDGTPSNYPWCIVVENGLGAKEQAQTGGVYMKKGSYRKLAGVFVNLNDYDFFKLILQTSRYINAWELANAPSRIREAQQQLGAMRERSSANAR